MRDLSKWLGFSLCLHLVIFGSLPYLSALRTSNIRPIIIDLSLADFPSTVARQSASRSPVAATTPPLPVVRKQSLEKVPIEKVNQPAAPAEVQRLPKELPAEQKVAKEVGGSTPVASESPGRGTPADRVATPAVSPEGNTKASTGNEKQRYLAEHFSYIRELVRKHLVYPTVAQRMGWAGKAVVAFVIMENGSVENIRLVESSGTPLLDRSALETIARAAPFPKPPVRAEIVIPVLFKLR